MKRNPTVVSWLVMFLIVLTGALFACDGDDDGDDADDNKQTTAPPAFQFNITSTCAANDGGGNAISQLDLVAGQTVTYCNNWSAQAQVKFSVTGFVPGGTDLTLQPGECVTHVVESTVVDGEYQWSYSCEGGTTSGMGGGPVKVDNPPPGP